ncbi:Hsp70 family protein [Gulosibacter chungangensis]|uniref:Hsp70 family protein n=1 Tax=Gulosibacter chungangensis TaxID=979746 RepID=UPI00178884ED|nr:Hsp70 family protein [Gulosibacter chungangensis]
MSKVTFSNGEVASINQDFPRDLLIRVADDLPYVTVTEDRAELYPAHEMYASAVGEALAVESVDAPADFRAAVAVPGWWTPRTLARVQDALRARGLDVLMVNDAEAAVVEYQRSTEPLPSTVAVVGLRASQVSAVVVKNCNTRPTALTSPVLVHNEGGDDLDVAVLQHVLQGLASDGYTVDPTDPDVLAAARASLADCRALRESLSLSVTESMQPEFPETTPRLRMVRSELEELATPWADTVVRTVGAVLEQCAAPIEAVLLMGGLANMPLISQRLSADLGLEVYVPDDPTLIVVRGAERLLNAQPMTELTESEHHAEPVREPETGTFWKLIRDRVSQWTGPVQTAVPQGESSVAPAPAPAPAPEEEMDTLLDPAATHEPIGTPDTSWIPTTARNESLVR